MGHKIDFWYNVKNKKSQFIFGCTSSSKKNVIRGMHLQTKFSQEKYSFCEENQ